MTLNIWLKSHWVVLAAILVLAGVLRLIGLDSVPPGLSPDEAVNGYDAYSLALTGRDHHGNFMPLTIQAFNDYRMPVFVYSAVPFVGLFGLEAGMVRGVAALWGVLNVLLVYGLARDLFDRRTGLLAAFLTAISVWHLPLSRYGHEAIVASCAVTLAVWMFFKWQARLELKWLVAAGLAAGLAFYSYGVMVLVVPLLLGALGVVFFQRSRAYILGLAGMALVVGLLTAPYWYLYFSFPEIYQARYADISILRQAGSLVGAIPLFVSNFLIHLSPDFVLLNGDRDLWYHPPGLGQFYWLQVPLVLLAFGGWRTHKRALLVLAAWIGIAILPAALTNEGLPHSVRTVAAIVPFQILAAFGLFVLLRWLGNVRTASGVRREGLPLWIGALVGILLLGQVIWFIGDYFWVYPRQAAARFYVGAEEAMHYIAAHQEDAPTINVTDRLNQAYIYVLFYLRYDPRRFQEGPVRQTRGVFDPVTAFDKYIFGEVEQLYEQNPQGLYLATPTELTDLEPLMIVRYPDGTPAYHIFTR